MGWQIVENLDETESFYLQANSHGIMNKKEIKCLSLAVLFKLHINHSGFQRAQATQTCTAGCCYQHYEAWTTAYACDTTRKQN